jgi:hypothetical protein
VSAPSPHGAGLVVRRVRVPRAEVAFLRYLLEAQDGLGLLYGDGGDTVELLAPVEREAELDRFLEDAALSLPLLRRA